MSFSSNKQILAKTGLTIIGLILLLSGFVKAFDVTGFAEQIGQYGFQNINFVAPLIVVIELILGICLLLRIRIKVISLLSLLMIFLFTLLYGYALFSHKMYECGCFGKIEFLKLPPAITIAKNIILMIWLLLIYKYQENKTVAKYKYLIAITLVVCGSFISGFSFHPDKIKIPQKHYMYKRAVKETVLPELFTISHDSTYIVFIFSYRCERCWDAIENLKRYNDSTIADKLVVLAAGKDSANIFKDYFKLDFSIQEVDEQLLLKLTKVSPTLFYIKNDTIRHVIQGSLPVSYFFKRDYLETN